MLDHTKLAYRRLKQNDADLFVKLRLDFLNELYDDIDVTTQKRIADALRKYFTKHLDKNELIVIICEYDGQPISTAYLIISELPPSNVYLDGKVATLVNVFTYPEYRNKGISTNIIKMLIDAAKEQDVSVIDLLATQAGEPVYEKAGFLDSEDRSMRLIL